MNEYGFIYITTNQINHKRYIGKKVYDRSGKWQNYLGSGIWLKRAIDVYGRDSFTREIIDVAMTRSELNDKEKYWIDFYDAVRDENFYNIAPGGEGGYVKSGFTDEQLLISEQKRFAAMRASIKCGEEAYRSKLTEKDVKSIIQRLLRDEYISDIAYDFSVSVSTISDIRAHKTWKHLTDGVVFSDISRRKRPHGKQVDVFTKHMEYVNTYDSAKDAEASLGVSCKLISQVCTGAKKSAHGYIFRFATS